MSSEMSIDSLSAELANCGLKGSRKASETTSVLKEPLSAQEDPYVEIIIQPISKKFRYECENRSSGTIYGTNSTSTNKTYPTIKIHNYIGKIRLVVSCVTKVEPYWPHPHKLIGREECKDGFFVKFYDVTHNSNTFPIRDLGIQCVKKCDVIAVLDERRANNIDPFQIGYEHIKTAHKIDLNAVRLCFEVFLPDEQGRYRRSLKPAVSSILYRANSELQVVLVNPSSGPAIGGTQVVLLCEKLNKDKLKVIFYLEENNRIVWETDVVMLYVHKQYAVVFHTPPFVDPYTSESVTVEFQLMRINDGVRSNTLRFTYSPVYTGLPTPQNSNSTE